MIQRRAFLLVDVMMAIVLVAIAIPACLYLLGSQTSINKQVGDATRALAIADCAMEYVASFPIVDSTNNYAYADSKLNDISDFDGYTFTTAIDAAGANLPNATGWTQKIAVKSFEISAPATAVAPTATNARFVTVSALYKGQTVYAISRVFAPTIPQ